MPAVLIMVDALSLVALGELFTDNAGFHRADPVVTNLLLASGEKSCGGEGKEEKAKKKKNSSENKKMQESYERRQHVSYIPLRSVRSISSYPGTRS